MSTQSVEAPGRMYSTESRVRTFARSLTWRASGVALAVLLTWYFTGSLALGVELGLVYNLIRLSTHYFHDRWWAGVRWGMQHGHDHHGNGASFSRETKLRTFTRSVTWRISGVALTVALAILMTQDVKLGVELGVSYNAIRLGTHYFHDRGWARLRWGMVHHEGEPPERPARQEPRFAAFTKRFFAADPGEPEVAVPRPEDDEGKAAPAVAATAPGEGHA